MSNCSFGRQRDCELYFKSYAQAGNALKVVRSPGRERASGVETPLRFVVSIAGDESPAYPKQGNVRALRL